MDTVAPQSISYSTKTSPTLSISSKQNGTNEKSEYQDAAVKRLAHRLYYLDGFNDLEVSEQLLRKSPFYDAVAREYLLHFNFESLTLEQALRLFLSKFSLTGESQEKERILQFFSQRFAQCHSQDNYSPEVCHLLACALLLLNTDLHTQVSCPIIAWFFVDLTLVVCNNLPINIVNLPLWVVSSCPRRPEVHRKMTCGEFIRNFTQACHGDILPSPLSRDMLKQFYENIKRSPLLWPGKVNGDTSNHSDNEGKGNGHNSAIQSQQWPLQNLVLMAGYVTRKCIYDSFNRKAGVLKRRSQTVFMRLCGLQLECYRSHEAAAMQSFSPTDEVPTPSSSSSFKGEEVDPQREDTTSLDRSQTELPVRSRVVPPEPGSESCHSMPLTSNSFSWRNLLLTSHVTSSSSHMSPAILGRPICIHHALATSCQHDSLLPESAKLMGDNESCASLPVVTGKELAFRLYTVEGGQFIFLLTSEDLVQRWIKAINYAAALLSSPPLPCPIGSQCNTFRPVYQFAYTTLTPKEQLRRHKEHLVYLKAEMHRTETTLQSWASSSMRDKCSDLEEKIQFLHFELSRFATYVEVLMEDAGGDCATSTEQLSCLATSMKERSPLAVSMDKLKISPATSPSPTGHYRTNSVSMLADWGSSQNFPSRTSSHRHGLLKFLQRKPS